MQIWIGETPGRKERDGGAEMTTHRTTTVGFTFWRWKFGFRVRRDGGCVLVRENAEKKTFKKKSAYVSYN
jgi:hypothetical protein